MFKGRTLGYRRQFDLINNVTANFEENIFEIYTIDGTAIKNGDTIIFAHDYDPAQSYNYFVYIIDSEGTRIRNIGNYTTASITHTIEDEDAAGISFQCYDNPSGTYKIAWDVRLYDNTMVDNPIEAVRYVKSNQNWSELGVSDNWGHTYITGALIKTSGEGSFNDSSLDEIKALKIARQITEYEQCWSNNIVDSICKEFGLISYQDASGYECIKYIFAEENPTDCIVYRDSKGNIGSIEDAQMSDIYCLPLIKYGKDEATGNYTGQLKVDKVWESTYNSSYVSGFSGADGEVVWNSCHALWLKTQQVEAMPADLSEKQWAPDYATALWCLKIMLKFMNAKYLPFKINSYERARKWEIGMHKCLLLSHHTSNKIMECCIVGIDKDKLNNEANLDLMILREVTGEDLELQFIEENGDYAYIEDINNYDFIEQ